MISWPYARAPGSTVVVVLCSARGLMIAQGTILWGFISADSLYGDTDILVRSE